jgi:hypothetical protein
LKSSGHSFTKNPHPRIGSAALPYAQHVAFENTLSIPLNASPDSPAEAAGKPRSSGFIHRLHGFHRFGLGRAPAQAAPPAPLCEPLRSLRENGGPSPFDFWPNPIRAFRAIRGHSLPDSQAGPLDFCRLLNNQPNPDRVGPFGLPERNNMSMKTTVLNLGLAIVATGCACCDLAQQGHQVPPNEMEIVKFTQDSDLGTWEVQDDVVMGGRSQGRLAVNEAGNAVFTGTVSLENNGGFSSIQRSFDPLDVSKYCALVLGLKGDGKRYQLRIDAIPDARHSYAYDFQTSGDWQAIEIPFADMYAIHHGDRLDLPNYPGKKLAQIQLLIGNNVAETFQLEIDKIWLK